MAKMFQYSTITSLATGNYDGEIKYSEIKNKGNFGIGTFHQLDGEMLAFDNNFYKITSDGNVYNVEDEMTCPFASVSEWKTTKEIKINKSIKNKDELNSIIQKSISDENQFIYGIMIKIDANKVLTRTVSKQVKPYKKLKDAAQEQTTFEINKTSGTIVGFITPKFLNTIGVEGIHVHFIDHLFKIGGHVFDFDDLKTNKIELSKIDEIEFKIGKKVFIQEDIQKEIHEAEK